MPRVMIEGVARGNRHFIPGYRRGVARGNRVKKGPLRTSPRSHGPAGQVYKDRISTGYQRPDW